MTAKPLALIVDDEPDICELIGITLTRMHVESRAAQDLRSAKALLSRHRFDLCLTDMRLPDGDGIDLVKFINREHQQIPVAVITAHGNMESAVEALKAGAFDFVSKPVDLQTLRQLVESALKLERASTPQSTAAEGNERDLIGDSAAMERVRSLIRKLARSQAPVYISGESGTGKELAARLIHRQGPRRDAPFIAVNCGAIPHELMESEFFGHKRGSFTGAHSDKEGLFQAADGGTLFLDEIADLPLHMQVKLLRVIQEKSVRPVGAREERHIDVRLISATHKDLGQLVASGAFRQDLFYRINVIELPLPPLRQRKEDIPQLAEWILEKLARQINIPRPRLETAALEKLSGYDFPGNVRELENILERALTLSEETLIGADDLQLPENSEPHQDGPDDLPLEELLEGIERRTITAALEQTHWNKTAAAKRLGLSFRALRYRLKKLGID